MNHISKGITIAIHKRWRAEDMCKCDMCRNGTLHIVLHFHYVDEGHETIHKGDIPCPNCSGSQKIFKELKGGIA